MGYKVQFDSGQTIEFDREPTPADIEEAYAQVSKQKPVQSATDFLQGRMDSERQVSRNLLGGALRGAGSIGATILAPLDWAARKAGIENEYIGRKDRREAMDQGLTSLFGSDPESLAYKLGKVGSEIAGTAGVGEAIGGVRALQAAAPNLAKAIQNYGFAPGVSKPIGAAGGAISGAAGSAMVNPDATEVGVGGAVGAAMPGVVRGTGNALKAFVNSRDGENLLAKKILTQALGKEAESTGLQAALAPAGKSVAEISAESGNINPVLQALQERVNERLNVVQDVAERNAAQQAANRGLIEDVAGGATQTEAKQSAQQAVQDLNAATEPVKNIELAAADTAGELLPKFQNEADRMSEAAANKVEDVRRFAGAKERAEENAQQFFPVPGQPRISGRYSYMDTLARSADDMMDQAANASLRFGDAARFSKEAAESLAAYGLKPLKADSVINKLDSILKNPKFAGNDLLESAVRQVQGDILRWTNNDGIIAANALDAIRKHSVNAVVQKMRPNMDVAQQNRLAASVLEDIKPKIIDAIEEAGGTGYRKYLEDYAKARQDIQQSKLGAKALEMFDKNPQEFVRLVEGNTPDVVEKIFGAGSYDITKQMSSQALEKLGKVSESLKRNTEMEAQAQMGREALEQLMKANLPKFKLPMFISWKIAAGNKILQALEDKIGKGTMDKLAKAMQEGKSTQELLHYVPPGERMRIINLMRKQENWGDVPVGLKGALSSSLIQGFAKSGNQSGAKK